MLNMITELMTCEVMPLRKFVSTQCSQPGKYSQSIIVNGESYSTTSRACPMLVDSVRADIISIYCPTWFESKVIFTECQLPLVEFISVIQWYHHSKTTQLQSQIKSLNTELEDTKRALVEERTTYTKLSEHTKSLELKIGNVISGLNRDPTLNRDSALDCESMSTTPTPRTTDGAHSECIDKL